MTPNPMNRDRFLRNVKQSGLVPTRDFRRLIDRLADERKPRALARTLVDWGLVTKFQAELLLAGRTKGFFLGPYRILDQLGQGGMGRVYKALHQGMNRTVALKVLAPHLVKTPKARKLFLREVQAAAQLNHPNIVTAYDANEVCGRHYLAMEFVDGPSLEQLVRRHGPLRVDMACAIVCQVAAGLQHAHEHAMLHRDVKPANLLLQPSKNMQSFVVKILDFGLARLNDPGAQDTAGTIETRANTVMGTPDFLSPEQARDLHNADIRSDLYSLGCTFYYLLTGKVPFPGGTTLEKLIRQSHEQPAPIDAFRQDVPAAVEAIVQRLMAKDPAERCQTPGELAALLAPHAGEPTLTWDDREDVCQRGLAGQPAHAPPLNEGEVDANRAEAGLIATLPFALAPTPISGFADGQILPSTKADEERSRLKRTAFLWSIGIVAFLVVTLLTTFFLLSR